MHNPRYVCCIKGWGRSLAACNVNDHNLNTVKSVAEERSSSSVD
ncbi:unnamed protein product [Linum tenue]|uniref:Uncharacterized protein n=1 Tax=Linum tenue TaxID=586396 RepID=A0AAV0P0G2_9ROSI|nr:unnamed protein product [Linum tenue]